MELHWFFDDKEYIQASVNDSWTSVFAGIILTALILFMFLHNPNSTFSLCSIFVFRQKTVLYPNSVWVTENFVNRIIFEKTIKLP